jgi:hypothetical protein
MEVGMGEILFYVGMIVFGLALYVISLGPHPKKHPK